MGLSWLRAKKYLAAKCFHGLFHTVRKVNDLGMGCRLLNRGSAVEPDSESQNWLPVLPVVCLCLLRVFNNKVIKEYEIPWVEKERSKMRIITMAIYGAIPSRLLLLNWGFSAQQVQKFYGRQIDLVSSNVLLFHSHKTGICQRNKWIKVQWRQSRQTEQN